MATAAPLGNSANHFLALKITDPKALQNICSLQQEVAKRHPSLEPTLIRPDKFHITVGTLKLTDQEAIRLSRSLRLIKSELVAAHKPRDMFVRLEGIGNFKNTSMHVKVKTESKKDKKFVDFVFDLRQKICDMHYEVTDMDKSKKEFTPHVTFMKLTRGLMGKTGLQMIPPGVVDTRLLHTYFGLQQVEAICLFKMGQQGKPYEELGQLSFV